MLPQRSPYTKLMHAAPVLTYSCITHPMPFESAAYRGNMHIKRGRHRPPPGSLSHTSVCAARHLHSHLCLPMNTALLLSEAVNKSLHLGHVPRYTRPSLAKSFRKKTRTTPPPAKRRAGGRCGRGLKNDDKQVCVFS